MTSYKRTKFYDFSMRFSHSFAFNKFIAFGGLIFVYESSRLDKFYKHNKPDEAECKIEIFLKRVNTWWNLSGTVAFFEVLMLVRQISKGYFYVTMHKIFTSKDLSCTNNCTNPSTFLQFLVMRYSSQNFMAHEIINEAMHTTHF